MTAMKIYLSDLPQEADCIAGQGDCGVPDVGEEVSQVNHIANLVLYQTVIMSVVCSLGLIGNIYVICVFAKHAKTQIMSRYIISRAIADIFLLLTVPFDAASHFQSSWLFGSLLCRLRSALAPMALLVGSVFQVGMCVNTYFEVCKPDPHRMLRGSTFKIFSIIAWSLFLILGLSIFVSSELLKEVRSERMHCVTILMHDTPVGLVIRIKSICLICIVPLFISWIFVNFIIFGKLHILDTSRQMTKGGLIAEARLKEFVFIITVAFTVFQGSYWLPYLAAEMVTDECSIKSLMNVFGVTISFPAINAMINSVLYLVYRKDFHRVEEYPRHRIREDTDMIPLFPIT